MIIVTAGASFTMLNLKSNEDTVRASFMQFTSSGFSIVFAFHMTHLAYLVK